MTTPSRSICGGRSASCSPPRRRSWSAAGQARPSRTSSRSSPMASGHICVDLDGTLAYYTGWKGPTDIGDPIPAMQVRVLAWLAAGQEVRIFTSRVSHDGTGPRMVEALHARQAIQAWCVTHLGVALPVTNQKDHQTIAIWDDRCVHVECNTGRILDGNDEVPHG